MVCGIWRWRASTPWRRALTWGALLALIVLVGLSIGEVLNGRGPLEIVPPATLANMPGIDPADWLWWVLPALLAWLLVGLAVIELDSNYADSFSSFALAALLALWAAAVFAWHYDTSSIATTVLLFVAYLPMYGVLAALYGHSATWPLLPIYLIFVIPLGALCAWFEWAAAFAFSAAIGGGGANPWAQVFIWLRIAWGLYTVWQLTAPDVAAIYILTYAAVLQGYLESSAAHAASDAVAIALITSMALFGAALFYVTWVRARWFAMPDHCYLVAWEPKEPKIA